MPELPEVETVKNILNTILPDATIIDVKVHKKGIIVGDVKVFEQTLIGRTFKQIERIGKYLIFTFDTNLIMLSHLRMEGKFIEVMPGGNNSRYAHVIFTLSDGRRLCYDDSRQFGKMELSTREEYLNTKSMQNVGEEPFTIDPKSYFNFLKTRNSPIKLSLLDQKLMSGLGNIYVDEVLYLSKVHPLTPSNTLDFSTVSTLIENSIKVLNKAIEAGGSTIRSYAAANGVHGNFQQELNAYGKADQRCPNCNFVYKKIFVGGRGTTFCPHCQVNPFSPKVIAITGQKAAGKSLIAAHLRAKGETVIDTDTLAKSLYQDVFVINEIENNLGISLYREDIFDLNLLRSHLIANPKDIQKLNNIVHPLVKTQMQKIIAETTAKVIYFEIPLPFSHKINELFDFFVGIEVTLERQKANLAQRGQELGVNPDREYMKNRYRLDYIIVNNGSIADLIAKFDQLKF